MPPPYLNLSYPTDLMDQVADAWVAHFLSDPDELALGYGELCRRFEWYARVALTDAADRVPER